MATYLQTQDVLDVVVSCFANYNTPSNPRPIKMITWLTNAKYQPVVDRIRAESDKSKRDAEKATLPAITPSGDFEYRSASKLKPNGHSRLIQFDIDLKDNPHIRNYTYLKSQIAKLPFVAYCGLSVSGTGYWGLVPIAYPERHGQHFDALKRVFAHYGINLDDKPRNVASLRGYSYDSDAYFAEQVMLFELYDEPKPQLVRHVNYNRFRDQDDTGLLDQIIRYAESASEGNRHVTLFNASRLAGGYVAAGRLDEQTVVYALDTIASEWPMHAKSQKTIRDGIRYGQAAPIYSEERTAPFVKQECVERPIYNTSHPTAKTSQATPVLILPNGETAVGEVLAVEPCDTYPAEWDEPISQHQAKDPEPVKPIIPFPQAPLAWDAAQQLRRIQWCVLPIDADEATYDPFTTHPGNGN